MRWDLSCVALKCIALEAASASAAPSLVPCSSPASLQPVAQGPGPRAQKVSLDFVTSLGFFDHPQYIYIYISYLYNIIYYNMI